MPLKPLEALEIGPAATAALRLALLTFAVVSSGSLLGCDSTSHCSANDQCASGFVCQSNKCVSLVTGRMLAVEILPPSNSAAALTELPGITFAGDLVPLTLDSSTQVIAMVEPEAAPMLYSSDAHVQVTLPSRIPGRSDLQITTEMANNQFMFGVGTSRLNTVLASFLFTPGSTTTQSQPPIPIFATLLPSLDFVFPTKSDMVVVRGQLVDDQNQPLAGYLARAYYPGPQGLQPISNAFPTMDDGTFALLIPPNAVSSKNDGIKLTLTPPVNQTAVPPIVDVPQFLSNAVSLSQLSAETKVAPHVYTLPAFIPATAGPAFQFVVTADGQPQSGVSVGFTMSVPVSADGNAVFQTSGMSDDNGVVSISLIPGTPAAPIAYQVMLQGRDSAFAYASQCIPALPINLDASGNPPPPMTFTLKSKVQLSGTVSDNKSAPVVSAHVTATQTSGLTDCGVAATPPPAASTVTGLGGDYKLLLDPGTYTIDLDPPTTGTYPRLTLAGANQVSLSSALVTNIMLPAPQIAMGIVYGSDGLPVPMATVQIFEAFCTQAPCGATQAPISRAQVTTDMDGKFQAVLPMPGS